MRFQLAKTLVGIKMYGPIYDLGTGGTEKVEEYVVEDTEGWFLDCMVDRINESCDTLLDDGDFDYINADKCENLIEMISSLPDGYIPDCYKNAVDVLVNYARRAIEYKTGIEIEL